MRYKIEHTGIEFDISTDVEAPTQECAAKKFMEAYAEKVGYEEDIEKITYGDPDERGFGWVDIETESGTFFVAVENVLGEVFSPDKYDLYVCEKEGNKYLTVEANYRPYQLKHISTDFLDCNEITALSEKFIENGLTEEFFLGNQYDYNDFREFADKYKKI